MGSNSHRAPEAWCSRRGTLQIHSAKAWRARTRTLQSQIPNTASDGLAPSAFDPSLEILHRLQSGVVLAAAILFFAVVSFVVCHVRRVIFLRGAIYNGRKGQAF